MRAPFTMISGADELVHRARAGDSEAFTTLVADHGQDVLRLCLLITTERSLAEDAAQNTWYQVWRRLGTVRDVRSFRPWLFKVASNEARQVLRRNRRHLAQSLDAARHVVATSHSSGVESLGVALLSLQPAERELLASRYVVGLSSEEIGRHHGLSAAGVRSRLKRIRDRMQKELEEDD